MSAICRAIRRADGFVEAHTYQILDRILEYKSDVCIYGSAGLVVEACFQVSNLVVRNIVPEPLGQLFANLL